MQGKFVKILLAAAMLAMVWTTLAAVDFVLDSNSETYHELTEKIDQRNINTGNAMNFFGDETSANAVYEATQITEHPPAKKQ